MKNNLQWFFTTVIFFITPFWVWSDQIKTKISADNITIEEAYILRAEGNVFVRHGNNTVRAKALKNLIKKI